MGQRESNMRSASETALIRALSAVEHAHSSKDLAWEVTAWNGRLSVRESRPDLQYRIQIVNYISSASVPRDVTDLVEQADAKAAAALHVASTALAAVNDLNRRLKNAGIRLDELPDENREDEADLTPDFASQWLAQHPEIAAQYRGKQVAIHKTDGIVASGDNYRAVRTALREKGYAAEDVVFDGIDDAFTHGL